MRISTGMWSPLWSCRIISSESARLRFKISASVRIGRMPIPSPPITPYTMLPSWEQDPHAWVFAIQNALLLWPEPRSWFAPFGTPPGSGRTRKIPLDPPDRPVVGCHQGQLTRARGPWLGRLGGWLSWLAACGRAGFQLPIFLPPTCQSSRERKEVTKSTDDPIPTAKSRNSSTGTSVVIGKGG